MSEIRNIISNFFSRVNCDLEEKEHVIIVNNVPKDFENLYGKKSPYTFSFEEYTEIESTEIVTSSSYLLTAISDYLKNKTKTSILKITFDNELLNYLNQRIDFRDYKIKNIIPNSKNDIIYKLTFLTNLQYLNENISSLIHFIYMMEN